MNDILKERARKTEELKNIFREQPETTITGVVGPDEPLSGWSKPNIYWQLKISLVAWKKQGEQINNSKLRITKDLAENRESSNIELNEIKTKVKRESLVQFKVKLAKDSPFGDDRAELITILEPPIDTELQSILDKSRQTEVINHPVFGVLEFNNVVNWFEGSIDWMGSSVTVHVSHDEKGFSDSSIETLETLHNESDKWSKKIVDYAVSTLLDLKNESWLEEGESEVSPTQFVQAMKLRSITVRPDGEFDFFHTDGNLFRGHLIQVSGSLAEGPTFSDIPG